jgi:hypothetical protein
MRGQGKISFPDPKYQVSLSPLSTMALRFENCKKRGNETFLWKSFLSSSFQFFNEECSRVLPFLMQGDETRGNIPMISYLLIIFF